MKVLFIVRNSFYAQPGGDTIQVLNTARHLASLGVCADIQPSREPVRYADYDLLHFFNAIRPADILTHMKKAKKPCVVSPILVNYSEYDKHHRSSFSGMLFRYLPGHVIEYMKTVARWMRGEALASKSYLWKGHRRSMREVLRGASCILPGSPMELHELKTSHRLSGKCLIVPNGIDPALFSENEPVEKDPCMVLCVGRIEGIKNQDKLIRALNNTPYMVYLIGSAATNQHRYYAYCRSLAAPNVKFIDHLPQDQLVNYYRKAKVHVLPSWFETCGLASLEAAAMGCNVVISNRGFSRDYFGPDAYYCDPSNPASILQAVEQAATAICNEKLKKKIMHTFTWQNTALQIRDAYNQVLNNNET